LSKVNLVVIHPDTGEVVDPTDNDIIWSYLGLAGIKAVSRYGGFTLAVSRQSDTQGPTHLLYENQLIYAQIRGWEDTFDIFDIRWVPELNQLRAFMKYGMDGTFTNSVELHDLIGITEIGNIYSHNLLMFEGNEYSV
jgi:hypothetical protein